MLYELRIYSIAAGRIPDIHGRMRDHLPTLVQKHGIPVVARWTARSGPNLPAFIYLMAWPDATARSKGWGGFYVDPEWARIRAETNGSSDIVERYQLLFIEPNRTWPAHDASVNLADGVHELVIQEVANGRAAVVNKYLSETYLPALKRHGGTAFGVFDFVVGPSIPSLALFIRWPDFPARSRTLDAIDADPGVQEALAAQRQSIGVTLFGRGTTYLMEPVSYAPPLPTLGFTPAGR